MFQQLNEINRKPDLFERYTADSLWADAHRSTQMLALHLNDFVDLSSRNTAFIDTSSAWIIDRFDLGPGKSVCDFGCGPGLYASRLARSGAQVTGLDFSETSIRYAREQAEKANQTINYIHANYLEADLNERFDLITMIMCDFCALSPTQRKSLLSLFYDHLNEDGSILMDVYSMHAYAEREESSFFEKNQLNHFWCEDDYYCFVNIFRYDDHAVVLDKYSIFSENGKTEVILNWLQYFSPERLKEELSASGFASKQLLKNVAGDPFSVHNAEFAIIATKNT